MRLAIIGLGRMGGNMVRRLIDAGHTVIGYNRSSEKTKKISNETGMTPIFSIEDIKTKLNSPRIVWSMVPAGDATEKIVAKLGDLLSKGDIFVDGGNAFYKDSIRRANYLKEKGIHFLDVGVSGGIWGLKEGYSLMIGGEREISEKLNPIFSSLAPAEDKGWGYVGPNGSGHYVKMIHNGIEYGMMEAIAEGFELMQSKEEFHLDLENIAKIWQHGSVVRSWLLDLTFASLQEDSNLSTIANWVDDSGEGKWTIHESIDQEIPTPIMAVSLYRRFFSRQENSFAMRLLSAMRNKFGGHAIKSSGKENE